MNVECPAHGSKSVQRRVEKQIGEKPLPCTCWHLRDAAVAEWRRHLLDAWMKDSRSLMTALLEDGPNYGGG